MTQYNSERLAGVLEVECITPDLNGVPRGKAMTVDGFLEGRRLQMARGVLLQCITGDYPDARFYGSDDGDLALVADPAHLYRLPWSQPPRALAICDACHCPAVGYCGQCLPAIASTA